MAVFPGQILKRIHFLARCWRYSTKRIQIYSFIRSPIADSHLPKHLDLDKILGASVYRSNNFYSIFLRVINMAELRDVRWLPRQRNASMGKSCQTQ